MLEFSLNHIADSIYKITFITKLLNFSTEQGLTTVSAKSYDGVFPANYFVPMAINNVGTVSLISYVGDFMGGANSITSFNLPVTTLEIVDNGFYTCENLTMSSLPRWMTKICSSAFAWCTKLVLSELPAGLTEIGSHAFDAGSDDLTINFGDGTSVRANYEDGYKS